MIATPKGEQSVEKLRAGDKVVTRDHGILEICWHSTTAIDRRRLSANPHLRPVFVPKDSLGSGLPERDMMVSPNLRILVAGNRTAIH